MVDLDAIKARLSNITTGKWCQGVYPDGDEEYLPDANILCEGEEVARADSTDDAAFIANAPADIAALVAEVERLYAVLRPSPAPLDQSAPSIKCPSSEAERVPASVRPLLEIVRRAWPGEWQHLGSNTYHLSVGSVLLPCSATLFGLHENDWVVQWAGHTIVRGQDLAAVLAEAREVVQGAVADVARAVGLEVSNA